MKLNLGVLMVLATSLGSATPAQPQTATAAPDNGQLMWISCSRRPAGGVIPMGTAQPGRGRSSWITNGTTTFSIIVSRTASRVTCVFWCDVQRHADRRDDSQQGTEAARGIADKACQSTPGSKRPAETCMLLLCSRPKSRNAQCRPKS